MKKRYDPKYINVPNICFSLTDKTDTREEEYSQQRIERGFDESEGWAFDCTVARFVLPRLKEFKCMYDEEKVDAMIEAFELIDRDNGSHCLWTSEEEARVIEGLRLFSDNLLGLGW